ncbi:hypothetical protein DERP_014609 [Dermatophagoides pteronyssinus]|uniref:Uncharacterized protein n=1 Tax=Dermatophagoides pteronyssinus TaxID=6956 RepID=A0ABQ8IWM1_DERPT|nr:hypothetical protein DERP_014609 [Dermatophagoides pteronyssinus]
MANKKLYSSSSSTSTNQSILFLITFMLLFFLQLLFVSPFTFKNNDKNAGDDDDGNSETIILHPVNFSKIKIKFDFGTDAQKFFKDQASSSYVPLQNDKAFNQTMVTSIIQNKLQRLKEFLSLEQLTFNSQQLNGTTPINDELILLDTFNMPIHLPEYKLNVSIDMIKISGINQFTVSDLAANTKSKKISALLRMPNIRLTMFYKVNGFAFKSKRMETYSDKGRLTYTIYGWRTVFAGKIAAIRNDDHLEIAGFGMRSHYNYYDSQMVTFINNEHGERSSPSSSSPTIDISKLIASNLMKKVINEVDDKFETIMIDHLGIHETGTWNLRPSDFSLSDEQQQQPQSSSKDDHDDDGQLWMMESRMNHESISRSGRRRNKRQVPCEPGEELDEYVDSLFRFLKRLVRVMEPFGLPNATIELEEYNLQIFLHSGGVTRAYTFERKKPAWVLCQNDTISLGLTVGIEDARIHYKYRVIQDWRLLFDGDLEAQLKKAKAQLQITQLSPPENEDDEFDIQDNGGSSDEEEEEPQVQQRVDKLKVWKPGQITVLIRGLGNFSSALSMLINSMLTDTSMFDPIIRMIETDGVVLANEMLRNVSIPIFSII